MPRYSLRTLLILLAIGPPMLAWTAPPLIRWLRPDPLLEIITQTIAPQSWDDLNGVGSIERIETSCFVLVVSESELESELPAEPTVEHPPSSNEPQYIIDPFAHRVPGPTSDYDPFK